MTLWDEFQESFPAPSSLQMRVDENHVLRSNEAKTAPSVYVCGCELCEARTDTEITYYHSVMDEMLLMTTPEPRRFDRMVHPIPSVSLYATMATVERVVHIYEYYTRIHDVDTEVPQRPIYFIVRMSDDNADDIEYRKKQQVDYLALMKMTPTRLVFLTVITNFQITFEEVMSCTIIRLFRVSVVHLIICYLVSR